MTRYIKILLYSKNEFVALALYTIFLWLDYTDITLIVILYWQIIYIYNFVSFRDSSLKYSSIIKIVYLWILLIMLTGIYLHFSSNIDSYDLFYIMILVGIVFIAIDSYSKIVGIINLIRIIVVVLVSILIVMFL